LRPDIWLHWSSFGTGKTLLQPGEGPYM